MKKGTAIIGCGPAGLLAAEAAWQQGQDIRILAPKTPSRIVGAQYLHKHVPGVVDERPDGQIHFIKMGTRDGYAHKVYGNMAMDVSWDQFDEGYRPYWSLARVYNKLWAKFENSIEDVTLKPNDIPEVMAEFRIVVNTAPLDRLCCERADHGFTAQHVYIKTREWEATRGAMPTIIYNGELSEKWYRCSRIEGWASYEYSQPIGDHTPPGCSITEINKPLLNFCDCHTGMYRVGRFGEWRKGTLSHDAYFSMMGILDKEGLLAVHEV